MIKMKKYERAAVSLRKKILNEMNSGDLLPPENKLACDIGVSVLTMRRGIELLVEEGLINRGQGRRSVVTRRKDYLLKIPKLKKCILIISLVKDFFYYELIGSLHTHLLNSGYTAKCIYLGCENFKTAEALSKKIEETIHCNTFDGLVILPVRTRHNLINKLLKDKTYPLVYFAVDKPVEENFVTIDMATGVYTGLCYLRQIGCKNILYLGRPAVGAWEREAGLYRFLKEFYPDKDMDDFYNFAEGTVESGYEAMKTIFQSGRIIDGVLAHNDLCATGIVMAAREFKVNLPDDLAIIGMDNVSYAQGILQSLTSIGQPQANIVEEIQRIFDQSFTRPNSKVLYNIILQPSLSIRESTSGFRRH